MKKIVFAVAIAASMLFVNAQAQVKNVGAAKAAVEKAAAATTNPKSNTKAATWTAYGKALLDAYNAPAGSVWVGMSAQELQMVSGSEKPVSEEQVTVSGQAMLKQVYANKNYYFAANGNLAIIEVTQPVVENSLEKALDAYKQAYTLDEKGQKTKDIKTGLETIVNKFSDEAYNAYTLGKPAEASVYFEKAYLAAGTAPLSVIDTNSVYNAAFTAFAAGDNARAKSLFNTSVELGYAGEDGDAYAKLADIAEKEGNNAERKAILEKGFAAYPSSQSILVGLINYYVSTGEDTNRLFTLLDNAKKNEPGNASLYYVEGTIHEKLGDEEKALASFAKCSEIDPKYVFGYYAAGVHFYNKAVELQEKANNEMDDRKYTAIMAEFEKALKGCVEPFEQCFQKTTDNDIKAGVAEYLKNACYRFRTDPEYQAKYDMYSKFNQQ